MNLTVGTSALDFGNVSMGGSKTSSFPLSNGSSSGQSVTVTQIGVTGIGFSLSSAPALPFVVAAGQNVTLVVKFAQKSAGSVPGSLSIECDAADPNPTLSLSGDSVAAGQLAVSPSTMNFGSVVVVSGKNLSGALMAGSSDVTV